MQKLQIFQKLLLSTLILFLLGAGLRVIGMTWGLPYQLHPDEPVLFINAWERWDTGSANLVEEYPEFYIWILTAQREFIYRVFGADTPQVIYFFFGRWNSILLSLLIMAVAYRLGKQLGDWQVGLFLMAFFAIEPISVLDQGWIIKGDNLAWLLMLTALWVTVIAHQRKSWQWLALAFVMSLLATYAKYNMLFVIFAPIFVALNFKLKREWLTLAVMLVGLMGGLYLGRVVVRHYWVDTIAPAFFHCADKPESELPEGQKGVKWLPCAPFVNFQDNVYPIYQREAFWDESTTRTLRYVFSLTRREFKPWGLAIGGLLVAGTLYGGSKGRRESIAILLAVMLPTLFLFAMFGAIHPIRQYYVLLASIAVLMAIGMGFLGKRQLIAYGLVAAILILPTLRSDLRGRADLLKPDSRAETAEYMLNNARRGEAVVVEYDAVEFQKQYGGFPEDDGYFNVILARRGVFALEAVDFFVDGIYYMVIDERAANPEFSGSQNAADLPADFTLVKAMEHEDYFGPARWIYRTFRPDHPLEARFGEVAEFIGYDLSQDDDRLNLKLYWHSLGTGLPDYTVFVHFRDAATGEVVQMNDQPPARPSSQWDQYEWVFDEREIPLELSAGTYEILIGLYDSQTGERLPVNGDTEGILNLGTFEIH